MEFWFLLLLGLFTYIIVQRSVAGITRTPVWLLWLVLMTPAIIWSTWTTVYGSSAALPMLLVIVPLIVCPVLYWLLVYWGRRGLNPSTTSTHIEATESKPDVKARETTPIRPISQTEETQLRSCFPWSVYYVNNIEYRPQAIICRGQLRTKPNAAYQQVRDNIKAQFGDRFLVIFQEDLQGKPLFAIVPNPQLAAHPKQRLKRPLLALGLLVATLFTTTLIGVEIAGGNLNGVQFDPSVLLKGLPYALALLTILGIHELGHYLTAEFYKIRTTLPYFIPVPFFLGTFGAFIQMRSPVPNRKALFDISIAGPVAGFIVTLPLLIWGLAHSPVVTLATQTETTTSLNIDAFNPRYSLLVAVLSKLALGSQLMPNQAIDLHPVAVAGLLGLVVTALNLMPVGQLDGGHIVHAMFGQRNAVAIGQFARLLVLGLALVQPIFLPWAIILFFMPIFDEPALNDVSELDNRRDFGGLLALAVLVLIILPLPSAIAQWLQI